MLPEWIEFKNQVEASKDSLAGADLSNKKLMQAKLQNAKLQGADLSFAYLIRADLRGADLSDVDFTGAVLSEANLRGANLENAEFEDAYLNGADLSEATNLTCDQIDLAYMDRETRLPDNIQIQWNSDDEFECCENG
jgi:uncharacterized protein YjbI with pentapeptide repeats